MKLLQRWKQTALHNKALVVTSVLVAFGTLFYSGAAVIQIWILKQSGEQTDRQIGRVIENINWLARSMDGALKQSQKSLDASIEQFRRDQRAWVSVLPSDIIWMQDGQPVSLTLQVINAGKTPAKHFDLNVRISILPSGVDPDFLYTPGHSRLHIAGNVILPNIPESFPVEALDNGHPQKPILLTTSERTQINNGELNFYTFGKATYQDVFGASHWFTFCRYGAGLPGTVMAPGKPSNKCAQYNDEDSN